MADADPYAQQAKTELRAKILVARAHRTEAERLLAGGSLRAHGLARLAELDRVAAYLAFGSEPPTKTLLDLLVAGGVTVVVPVVDGETLDWVVYDPAEQPEPDALGIPAPTGPRVGTATLQQVDAVLVPALAADRHGNRLGRGRGYYDRALTAVACPVIAVVYDEELVASVPTEAHDRRVDAVLTPSAWVDLAER